MGAAPGFLITRFWADALLWTDSLSSEPVSSSLGSLSRNSSILSEAIMSFWILDMAFMAFIAFIGVASTSSSRTTFIAFAGFIAFIPEAFFGEAFMAFIGEAFIGEAFIGLARGDAAFIGLARGDAAFIGEAIIAETGGGRTEENGGRVATAGTKRSLPEHSEHSLRSQNEAGRVTTMCLDYAELHQSYSITFVIPL